MGGRSGVLILLALLALPIELGFSAGPAFADAGESVTSPMLRARLGVDVAEHLSLNAAILGAAGGSEPSRVFCGGPCAQSPSFRAIAGHLSLRFRSLGEVQGFGEVGVGAGHLINLSGADLFENPA